MSSFIEDFAKHLGVWLKDVIPGIEDRTFAVSEVDPFTKDNMPTLPIGFVGMVGKTFASFPNGTMTFVAEVALEPVRALEGDCETPFWAYYDVDAVSDAVFSGLFSIEDKWRTKVTPTQVIVEADRLAVYISMTFTRSIIWRDPEDCSPVEKCEPNAQPAGIRFVVNSGPVDPCACPPPHPEECQCNQCWMDEEKEAENG